VRGRPGWAAAVNAASEGLRTVVAEAVAPGGQAGTTSMIENQGGSAEHLARGQAAVHIPADPVRHRGAGPVPVERRRVQAELSGVPVQVAVLERLLPVEQQLVHVPEPPLQRSGRGRRGQSVRVNAGQRKMPEREPHVPAELAFDLLDRVERLPRVRALIIAVLDNQAAGGRAANMIDLLIQRRQGQLAVLRRCVDSHRTPPSACGQIGLGPAVQ